MRLFAVRHGATEYSRDRRFTGSRDVPLTTDGRLQAEAVAQALAGAAVAAVYTSPLERARMCAELVAKPHRLEPRVVPELSEMAFGAWEGLSRDELAARFPRDAEARSEEHTSELQSHVNLVCRFLLEKKKKN